MKSLLFLISMSFIAMSTFSAEIEYSQVYVCRDSFDVTIKIDADGKAFATGYNTDVDDLEFKDVEGSVYIEDGYLHFTPMDKRELDYQQRYDEIVVHLKDYCKVVK